MLEFRCYFSCSWGTEDVRRRTVAISGLLKDCMCIVCVSMCVCLSVCVWVCVCVCCVYYNYEV